MQFKVIEARYDQVQVANHSRVQTNLLNATLSPLHNGQLVTQDGLDRQLLLLNDLQVVQGHAVLGPGSAPGTSDLSVDAQALPLVTGNLTLDDAGDRYTGGIRLGGNVAVNNLAGLGDQFSVGLLASDEHMHYGHVAYDFAMVQAPGSDWHALHGPTLRSRGCAVRERSGDWRTAYRIAGGAGFAGCGEAAVVLRALRGSDRAAREVHVASVRVVGAVAVRN